MKKERVVIIGGGFAGINLAKGLIDSRFDVLILDKKNHHVFQPLLYQVAAKKSLCLYNTPFFDKTKFLTIIYNFGQFSQFSP